MKKILISLILLVSIIFSNTSCSEFLNIVPEGVANMDNAFSNRANSERYLMTCYSYLPNFSTPSNSLGFLAGDEYWVYPKGTGSLSSRLGGIDCWEIGRGAQNSNAPYMNYWEGEKSAKSLWKGIRDCNIFLENIHKPMDLQEYERVRWIAEVKFLKAYYHFYLMQLYGPIPIMDKNIDVNAGTDAVRRYRDRIDEITDYIVTLLDECVTNLPPRISDAGLELGRITKPIALSVKAQVLLFTASPLMNGNSDYIEIVDNRGVKLFPQDYDAEKWKKAADAALEAIVKAEEGRHILYKYLDNADISDTTRTFLSIGGAVSDRWNDEIIWGDTRGTNRLQTLGMYKLSKVNQYYGAESLLAPTLTIAEQFYSANGVPLNEDKGAFWSSNYSKRYDVVDIEDNDENKYKLAAGEQTAILHLNREPRFYANLAFDRCKIYNDQCENDRDKAWTLKFRSGKEEYSGTKGPDTYSITGYLPRKIINVKTGLTANAILVHNYAFPIIRLADLYLMYAEALNEYKSAPDAEVYLYIDKIRERAGLEGVVDSWTEHSRFPTNVTTKDGMRKIIRMERLNELALEGKRFWDMRRWKEELSRSVKGWNINGETAVEFYRVTEVFNRSRYYYRDFLWPIKDDAIQKNANLLQNPGW